MEWKYVGEAGLELKSRNSHSLGVVTTSAGCGQLLAADDSERLLTCYAPRCVATSSVISFASVNYVPYVDLTQLNTDLRTKNCALHMVDSYLTTL